MRQFTNVVLLGIAASTAIFAVATAPEIDPGTGASAITLLAGALLVVRSYRRKR